MGLWVTKEDALSRTRGEFVGGGSREVGVAEASEDAEVGVGRGSAI
ncbi:unnamed protein product [Cuscuta campestris]|uniref:Uncharacterized protein n=1 Tax=Cuscuta campestris TaxID=132261 RepID=A0A484MQU4_9ASTE|nr:unnamed protein product [Cuscuta campestris]